MTKKPKPKNKRPSKKYSKYTISGEKLERKENCPKCGQGIFLAIHKGRKHCGRCAYTLFESM